MFGPVSIYIKCTANCTVYAENSGRKKHFIKPGAAIHIKTVYFIFFRKYDCISCTGIYRCEDVFKKVGSTYSQVLTELFKFKVSK